MDLKCRVHQAANLLTWSSVWLFLLFLLLVFCCKEKNLSKLTIYDNIMFPKNDQSTSDRRPCFVAWPVTGIQHICQRCHFLEHKVGDVVGDRGSPLEFWLVGLKAGFAVLCGANQSSPCEQLFPVYCCCTTSCLLARLRAKCKSGWTVFVNIYDCGTNLSSYQILIPPALQGAVSCSSAP